MAVKEKEIELEILDWVNRHKNGFAFKVNPTAQYDPKLKMYRKPGKFVLKGTADIIGIWAGKPLAIEVKRPGGRKSKEQKAFVDKYRGMGGIAFFAFNLDEVRHHLEYFDKNGSMIV
jgi:hypothetical protein